MSPSPTENSWLRLEPPFFVEGELKLHGLNSRGIDVAFFDDDKIAASVTFSLRSSIERFLEKEDSSDV